MVYIYTLLLENNKYYIGKTNNPDIRLDNHFNSFGSNWTNKYKPLHVIEILNNCDDYDEDKYTLKYMAEYGINNVRGGSFCQIILAPEYIRTIKQMIAGSSDRCYLCNSTEHFANKCMEKAMPKSDDEQQDIPQDEHDDTFFNNIIPKTLSYIEKVYNKIIENLYENESLIKIGFENDRSGYTIAYITNLGNIIYSSFDKIRNRIELIEKLECHNYILDEITIRNIKIFTFKSKYCNKLKKELQQFLPDFKNEEENMHFNKTQTYINNLITTNNSTTTNNLIILKYLLIEVFDKSLWFDLDYEYRYSDDPTLKSLWKKNALNVRKDILNNFIDFDNIKLILNKIDKNLYEHNNNRATFHTITPENLQKKRSQIQQLKIDLEMLRNPNYSIFFDFYSDLLLVF